MSKGVYKTKTPLKITFELGVKGGRRPPKGTDVYTFAHLKHQPIGLVHK